MNKNEKQTQSNSDILSNILSSTECFKQDKQTMFVIL
jgi:hypothetical protein